MLRPKNLPRDPAQRAKAIIDIATGTIDSPMVDEQKRQGGLAGGKARAEKLSKKKRSTIAKRAATQRWSKHQK